MPTCQMNHPFYSILGITVLFFLISAAPAIAANPSKITGVQINRDYTALVGEVNPSTAIYKPNSKKYTTTVTLMSDPGTIGIGDKMSLQFALKAATGYDFSWLKLNSCTSPVGEFTHLSLSPDKKTATLDFIADPLPVELAAPSGLEWDGCVAKWGNVEWAAHYEIHAYQILPTGKLSPAIKKIITPKSEADLKSATHRQAGDYVFSVLAIGSKINTYLLRSKKSILAYDKSLTVHENEIGYHGGSWHAQKENWKYATAPSSKTNTGPSRYLSNGRYLVEGEVYCFNETGYRQTGWQYYSGAWSYHNDEGKAFAGWLTQNENRYYLNPKNCLMTTGWLVLASKRYYFDTDGILATGWKRIEGDVYYMNSDGSAQTDRMIDPNGILYDFKNDGALIR